MGFAFVVVYLSGLWAVTPSYSTFVACEAGADEVRQAPQSPDDEVYEVSNCFQVSKKDDSQ